MSAGPAWCPWAGLNCRPLPYQGSALPLSYMGRPLPASELATLGSKKADPLESAFH
ncbi:protein of unknown function [Thauera humireducens]|nr:protein of unknown function [Thauera humireducens]